MKKYLFIFAAMATLASCTSTPKVVAVCECDQNGTQIIAHRGYWAKEGSYENTLSSLDNAQQCCFYGSEFDAILTADDVFIVNHDKTIGDIKIQETPYNNIKTIKLPNGETRPLLKEYLAKGKSIAGVKMILEIKPHDTLEKEDEAIRQSMQLIKKFKMEDQVEIISFDLYVCQEYAQKMPEIPCAYLGGRLSPAKLHEMGISGLDYHYSQFFDHPEWIEEAHELGMTVNVWTVDKPEMAAKLVKMGVDFITTNDPELMRKVVANPDEYLEPATETSEE